MDGAVLNVIGSETTAELVSDFLPVADQVRLPQSVMVQIAQQSK